MTLKKSPSFIFSTILVSIVIVVLAILVLGPKETGKIAISMSMTGDPAENFSARIQPDAPIYDFVVEGDLRYDLIQVQPPVFKVNHAFNGYACGSFDYTFELDEAKTELIINEIQYPTCRKKEDFYIDTLFRLPDTLQAITLNEFINDEKVDSHGYIIDRSTPIFPLPTANPEVNAESTPTQ